MTESFFTRATWRKGKRRATYPRTQPWAGCTIAPAAFLAAARLAGLQNGLGKRRRCEAVARSTGRRCKCAAMNFARYCYKHGGPRDAAKRRPYVPGKFAQRAIAERALGLRPSRVRPSQL
jgi:hypothetical protein